MENFDLTKAVEIDPNVSEFLGKHSFDHRIFAIDGVIEVLRAPIPPGWGPTSIKVELVKNGEYPLDPEAIQLLNPYKEKLAGQGWEVKHRVAALDATSSKKSTLQVIFAPTTYEEGTGFHRSLVEGTNQEDSLTLALKERLAIQLTRVGKYSVPGVAVVHVLVVTNDDRLVFCQRSPYAGYHPSRWSVSFEEQINQKDLAFGNTALSAAAIRGFQEEFASGHVITLDDIRILGVFLEYNILNMAFCVYVKAPLSFDEIKSNWDTKAKDKWEAIKIVAEPFTLENIVRFLQLGYYGEIEAKREKFHSTSKYRLFLAAVNRFGLDAVNHAFKSL